MNESSSQRKKRIAAAKKTIKKAYRNVPSPRLSTIRMVENVFKKEGFLKIAELKRKLPKQINHNTLMAVLEYLEESNKIYSSIKGIGWLVNNSRKFNEALRNSYDYDVMLAETEAKLKLMRAELAKKHEKNKD